MFAVSLLLMFMGAIIVVSSANNINLKRLLDLTISFRRLGAEGSYLTLVRVADRIL